MEVSTLFIWLAMQDTSMMHCFSHSSLDFVAKRVVAPHRLALGRLKNRVTLIRFIYESIRTTAACLFGSEAVNISHTVPSLIRRFHESELVELPESDLSIPFAPLFSSVHFSFSKSVNSFSTKAHSCKTVSVWVNYSDTNSWILLLSATNPAWSHHIAFLCFLQNRAQRSLSFSKRHHLRNLSLLELDSIQLLINLKHQIGHQVSPFPAMSKHTFIIHHLILHFQKSL